MSNHVLLNNVDHKDLKIITERSARFGDDVMYGFTFPFEFRNIQAHYPIFFQKDPNSDKYYPVAMLGLQQGENLFLGEHGWDADYIPVAIERQPFLIGFEGADGDAHTVVHVDMDSPRVSETEGEPVFLEHGGNTPYLNRVAALLDALYQGDQENARFVQALVEHDLLESFTLDMELKDGSKNRLAGFYTINEDKLAVLDGDVLSALHKEGHLQAIYMVLASLSHMRELIMRKNARL
ncbi:SapC family protein [Kordiimonas aestuarii]|uniref:SapC family protein n=1 Tax=Kordiimonas aestuarii TaxID=1005925 RepID=UPI0021D3A5AF|nr:SapC family protein [Kordiimonas aestuarii]